MSEDKKDLLINAILSDVTLCKDMAQAYKETKNTVLAFVAEVRREALLEACKAACEDCRNDIPVRELPHGYFEGRTEFAHEDPESDFMPKCMANCIRQMLAAEAAQGQNQS